jgi:hypothetical protein
MIRPGLLFSATPMCQRSRMRIGGSEIWERASAPMIRPARESERIGHPSSFATQWICMFGAAIYLYGSAKPW